MLFQVHSQNQMLEPLGEILHSKEMFKAILEPTGLPTRSQNPNIFAKSSGLDHDAELPVTFWNEPGETASIWGRNACPPFAELSPKRNYASDVRISHTILGPQNQTTTKHKSSKK